jgi:predicted phosphoribosyltransferase
MKFADRAAAGRQLAPKLAPFKDRTPVVLAPPRGAVAVGFEIAQALGAPRSSSMTALPPVPRCGCAVRRRDPAHLVRAVPVAPPECWAIGFYYRDFHQMSDAEITDLLAHAAQLTSEGDPVNPLAAEAS